MSTRIFGFLLNPHNGSSVGHPACCFTFNSADSFGIGDESVVCADVGGTYMMVMAVGSGLSGSPGTSVPTVCGRIGEKKLPSEPCAEPEYVPAPAIIRS